MTTMYKKLNSTEDKERWSYDHLSYYDRRISNCELDDCSFSGFNHECVVVLFWIPTS